MALIPGWQVPRLHVGHAPPPPIALPTRPCHCLRTVTPCWHVDGRNRTRRCPPPTARRVEALRGGKDRRTDQGHLARRHVEVEAAAEPRSLAPSASAPRPGRGMAAVSFQAQCEVGSLR